MITYYIFDRIKKANSNAKRRNHFDHQETTGIF